MHNARGWVEDDALSITHHGEPRISFLNGMAHLTQRIDRFGRETTLHQQYLFVSSAVNPARHLDGLLDIQAEALHCRIDLEMSLRLTIAAHRAKDHHRSPIAQG